MKEYFMPINKFRVCGHKFFEEPLLWYENMPRAAQFLPDAESLENDKGVDLEVCQCLGCGLVQLSNKPVPYHTFYIKSMCKHANIVMWDHYQALKCNPLYRWINQWGITNALWNCIKKNNTGKKGRRFIIKIQITSKETSTRNKLKEEKPYVYEKVMKFDEKMKRGESIAIIQFQYNYTCNLACEHCSIKRFQGKKEGRSFTIYDVK